MNSIIKGGLIVLMLVIPSLANATFFKAPQQGEWLEEFSLMSWHREGKQKISLLPVLKHLFDAEREKRAWLNFLPAEKRKWSEPKLRYIRIGHDLGFKHSKWWRQKDWSKCHEVPLPAAWPLFALALFSLGLIKKRQ